MLIDGYTSHFETPLLVETLVPRQAQSSIVTAQHVCKHLIQRLEHVLLRGLCPKNVALPFGTEDDGIGTAHIALQYLPLISHLYIPHDISNAVE